MSYDDDLKTAFKNLTYKDVWADADVTLAIRYVFGSKKLRVPESWREIIPRTLSARPL